MRDVELRDVDFLRAVGLLRLELERDVDFFLLEGLDEVLRDDVDLRPVDLRPVDLRLAGDFRRDVDLRLDVDFRLDVDLRLEGLDVVRLRADVVLLRPVDLRLDVLLRDAVLLDEDELRDVDFLRPDELEEPDDFLRPPPEALPPRFEAPGEFEIAAARPLLMPFFLRPSYCLSFLTLEPWSFATTNTPPLCGLALVMAYPFFRVP